MTPLITKEVAVNIAWHTQLAWAYSVPNDSTGELVITHGLKPFYPDAEQRGGSTTIVDIKVNNIAYDVKCRDVLSVFTKERSSKQLARAPGKTYFPVDDLWVSRPASVLSPVRRPNVELENYQGDCQRIITEQIAEYKQYADRTVAKAGCTELRSLIFLYGEKNGYKSIYIDEQPFTTPVPTFYESEKSYRALDANHKLLYEISDYSKGSTNFNKRFDCNSGYLFVWPSQALSTDIMDIDVWANSGNYVSVI
jgi:hypothetical protein